jgi:16S rRNA (uracil1498-N3)-methyltransferase
VGKGDKLDAIVRDATELGATRVVPVLSARTTVRPEGRGKSERWERIALEAARQCGRGDCVRVEPPTPLVEALAHYIAPAPGLSLVLDPSSARAAGELLRELPANAPLTFVVGPEGGLEEEEIGEAEAQGYTPASLGPFVLRTETVCAALLGALLLSGVPSPRSS